MKIPWFSNDAELHGELMPKDTTRGNAGEGRNETYTIPGNRLEVLPIAVSVTCSVSS